MSEEKIAPDTTLIKAMIILDSQTIPIEKPITTIGRKLGNDVMIQNNQVSRVHAEIRYYDGEFTLTDLGSTSGTYINNEKITVSKIYSGDVIRIANVPITFIYEKDPSYEVMEQRTEQLRKKVK